MLVFSGNDVDMHIARMNKKLAGLYVICLASVIKKYGLKLCDAELSKRELGHALAEIILDIQAMYARRTGSNGLSAGKIAGIMAFRLARFEIVHLTGDAIENDSAHLIKPVTAIGLAIAFMLPKKQVKDSVLRELCYQLSRRHANQETLGAMFDMIALTG